MLEHSGVLVGVRWLYWPVAWIIAAVKCYTLHRVKAQRHTHTPDAETQPERPFPLRLPATTRIC